MALDEEVYPEEAQQEKHRAIDQPGTSRSLEDDLISCEEDAPSEHNFHDTDRTAI